MKQFLKKRWYVILFITLMLGFLLYQTTTLGRSGGKKEVKYTVKRGNLKETLSLSGQINADEHVILRFQTSGKLAWVGVKEGDYVKKYQSIASLDQRELQKTLKKYLLAYENDRSAYDQSLDDNKTGLVDMSVDLRHKAQRLVSAAQANLDSGVLDVELKNLSLEYTNLFSPIEGVVTRVESSYAGVNVTPTQAEFEIINPKTIYFAATSDQTDVIKLREGLSGGIILDAYPNLNLPGTVSRISFTPKVGETGTVYGIKIALKTDETGNQYRFGMTGDVNFTIREKNNVLFVPTTYIKTDKNRKYVMKKENGNQVKTYVETGEQIDDNTIITSGLKEGDVVYD